MRWKYLSDDCYCIHIATTRSNVSVIVYLDRGCAAFPSRLLSIPDIYSLNLSQLSAIKVCSIYLSVLYFLTLRDFTRVRRGTL